MRIHTKTIYQWDDGLNQYVKVYDEGFDYRGPVDLVCGPTAAQTQILNQQQGFATQVANQAGSIFGKASTVFNAVTNSLLPTISAGPNTMGFSAGELAARNAGVVSAGAQAAANAKSAIGNANAAQGGGNTGLTAGETTVEGANTTADIAEKTASELNKVQQEGYDAGRQEYNEAIKGAEGSTEVFNPATSAANAATESLKGAASTANTVAEQQQSWQNAAIGALGGVAGAATGGFIKKMGNNSNNSAPSSDNVAPIGSGSDSSGTGWGDIG